LNATPPPHNTLVRVRKRRPRRAARACACIFDGHRGFIVFQLKSKSEEIAVSVDERDTRTDPALSIVAVRAGDAFVNSHSVANIDAAKRWRDTRAPLCSFMISLLSSHKIFFFISS